MHIPGVPRARTAAAAVSAAAVAAAVLLAGCGGAPGTDGGAKRSTGQPASDPTRIPGVGDRYQSQIPDRARQVVAVYGKGHDAAGARVELYTRQEDDRTWSLDRGWAAHNGKRGWTTDHHEGDKRSPVGVFTLSDAGGVLPDPGTELPYTHSDAFTPPSYWHASTRHDFDHVIAIDYNRVRGSSPLDQRRPAGRSKGGGIWLHLDHGSGTSGCVSLSRPGMEYLLRTLDPDRDPVVVMGDRAALRS